MSSQWRVEQPDWKGETVFIIGGGSSVAGLQLDRLAGRRVIVINSSYQAYPAADILIFCDKRWFDHERIERRFQIDAFKGRVVTTCQGAQGPPRLWRLHRSKPADGLARDVGTVAAEFSTLSAALNLAFHLGAARIVLLGIDGKTGANGRSHHHVPHPWKPVANAWTLQAEELQRIAADLRDRGIEVLNASPDSAWQLWPRMTFDQAIAAVDPKPPFVLTTFWGLGDNLHVRAIVRELVKSYSVHLLTCHVELYHDFVEQHGVKIHLRPTNLRAQAKSIQRERLGFVLSPPPPGATARQTAYGLDGVRKAGSILQAMIESVGLSIERPDFSLPVKPEWREQLGKKVVFPLNKPLLVFRPPTIRKEYPPTARRNPHAGDFAKLYEWLRDRDYWVVSVADLQAGEEWIEGGPFNVDRELHVGELTFGDMAALWERADLFFGAAGFGPILAQAVGTPSITVFGGNECYATTQRAGAHLAPSLGIDPIAPCDCHGGYRGCKKSCDKRIDVPAAIARMQAFIDSASIEHLAAGSSSGATDHPANTSDKPRILIFGTVFEDNATRARLTDLWVELHRAVNPDCDLLLVDSESPHMPRIPARHPHGVAYFNFGDNIGHLSRKGRDGWGRAFCRGLELAIANYDFAVHVEADSLFARPVRPIVEDMRRTGVKALSPPVAGMRIAGSEAGWTETGLMFLDCRFVDASRLVERYAWPTRQKSPTPERVIRELLGSDLQLAAWRAWRGDKNVITATNVVGLKLDWLTHVHNDPAAYEAFANDVLARLGACADHRDYSLDRDRKPDPIKINLGCGSNRLDGWQNHDSDVDIAKPLPFADSSASLILCEHCVEHIGYKQAIDFFREARRVLRPGGILRVIVPSVEQIRRSIDADYHRFTTKWQNVGPNVRGALHAIIYCHGHESAWTASLLEATLFFAGFDRINQCLPGGSSHAELAGVDGHARVIGTKFNAIESIAFEAMKDGNS